MGQQARRPCPGGFKSKELKVFAKLKQAGKTRQGMPVYRCAGLVDFRRFAFESLGYAGRFKYGAQTLRPVDQLGSSRLFC